MKSRYFSLLVLLITLVGSIGIFAETKKQTKLELCVDALEKCITSATLVEDIAKKTNSEAMDLKFKKENLEFDKTDINFEIKELKYQLANPGSRTLHGTTVARTGGGFSEVRFSYSTFNNTCSSLLDCLGLLQGIQSYWTEMEDLKTNYTTEINVLEDEKAALIRTRDSLQQQIANSYRNRN